MAPRRKGVPLGSRSSTRGRTAWQGHTITPPAEKLTSILHPQCFISTHTGCRCTACRGPYSPGRPTGARQDFLAARLDWTRDDLLVVFPFPHCLEMTATLRADSLTIETILVAGSDGDVPVSFGFHPYFGLADFPRARWRLKLPVMRRLTLDDRGDSDRCG